MLTLYFSPHMTSIDNEAGRASGHADIPLSPKGLEEASMLGMHYAAIAVDAVYCSDLQRAIETARLAFALRALPVTPDARLRECDYGALTQRPKELIDAEFPKRIETPFPGGESVRLVADRVGDFLREVSARHAGQTIVIIGHRATKYGIDHWATGRPLDEIVRAPWEWREVPIWRYEIGATG